MKRSRLIALAAPVLVIAVLMTSCGQTYHLQSITIAPTTTTIEGIQNYASFRVTGQLSNGQTPDVTAKATFTVAAPGDTSPGGQIYMTQQLKVIQGTSNQIQAIGPVCSWYWIKNADGSYTYQPDPFIVTATFENQTAEARLSVNSMIGSGACFDPSNPAPPGTPSGTGIN